MCVVWHRFIRQHSTQGNGRPSEFEYRALAGFIHFRGSFYEELMRNHQRPWGADWKHTCSSWLPCPDNNQNNNHSLLLWRAFMANVGAVFNMQTNQLCLTRINPDVHSDPIRVMRPWTSDTGLTPDSLQHATAIMRMNTKPSIQERLTARSHHRLTETFIHRSTTRH